MESSNDHLQKKHASNIADLGKNLLDELIVGANSEKYIAALSQAIATNNSLKLLGFLESKLTSENLMLI